MTARRALIALAPALVSLLVACGGSGSSSSTSATTTAASPPSAATANPTSHEGAPRRHASTVPSRRSAPPSPARHHDSGGGAAQFRTKGGDNSIQESGEEASASERERAATALHGYLDAEARRDWQVACNYMSAQALRFATQLTRGTKVAGKGCPALLAILFEHAPPSGLATAAQANVGSLRIHGNHAFILYHGAHHLGYAMPMVIEAGRWKVAALGGSALR